MADRIYNALFLCTGNSARSILAESLLNHWGRGKLRGFSAGSVPKGQVHTFAVMCPVWPGKPMTAHWGIADPAAVEGTNMERAAAFRKAFKELETRIKLFTSLPIGSLDSMTLQSRLCEIGKAPTEPGN